MAGRIAIVELGTLKANEYFQTPFPSFYTIFDQKLSIDTMDFLEGLVSQHEFKKMMQFYLKGGYPEPVLSNQKAVHAIWMENYFKSYIQTDIKRLFPRLDSIKYRRFVSMLSTLSGTVINRSEIGRSINTSEVTIRDYLDIVHGSFIWRRIPIFDKSKRRSIVKMSKGIFRDSGLAHYLKQIYTVEELNRHPYVGIDFEAFISEEIIKGVQSICNIGPDISYFRTKNGAEVDLILEGSFGLLPIEIKYGVRTTKNELRSLHQFIDRHQLPFGIVVNTADIVRRISDHVIQIPWGAI